MGAETGIAWTDHTFNPWWGCQRVSPGCENCYAETWDRRWGGEHWGPTTERRFFDDAHWREPEKWNSAAEKEGRRARVFCASMADVFEDRRDLDAQRARLWKLIERTPHLDWQLLTKRPENIAEMVPAHWIPYPLRNVWLGTTVEDQQRADERIPALLGVPAHVRFLSCEPLLSELTLAQPLGLMWHVTTPYHHPAGTFGETKAGWARSYNVHTREPIKSGIDWCIIGGESGGGARPTRIEWVRSLAEQCRAANVATFVKQWGSRLQVAFYDDARDDFEERGHDWTPVGWSELDGQPQPDAVVELRLPKKGGDLAAVPGDWPREFPEVRRAD